MNNLKCFEDFMSYYTKPINKSFKLTKDDVDDIMSDWEDVLYTKKEWNNLKKSILSLLQTNFSIDDTGKLLGMENFPETIKLYRILEVVSVDDINLKNLGKHWTTKKETLYNDKFKFDIGLFGNEGEWYIVEAIFKKEDINPIQTVIMQLSNEGENEITIKEYSTPVEYKIDSYL